jgi:iron complex outermembrane receptor protein
MIRIDQKKAVAGIFFVLCSGWSSMTDASVEVPSYLDLDIEQLIQLTVTSVAKKEQALSDSTAAVYVITQEDIRRSGVTTIPDALAMAPGVQVAKISASKWSVSSRGFSGYLSNKLLVLIDGRSVYSPVHSGTFWDSQNTLLEDIDRIEVIRGPGGTLWGANAVNGVINIITKKAVDTQGTLVRVGAGNQEKIMGGTRYGGKISDTAYGRLYLTYNDHGGNTLKNGGGDANDDWQPAQGGFRIDGRSGVDKEWTLQGDLYHNGGNQTIFPYWISQPPYMTATDAKVNVEGGNLLGRWHKEWGTGQALTFKVYYDSATRDEKLYDQRWNTVDVDMQYETRWGQRQNLTMGNGFRSIQGTFEPVFQASLPDVTDSICNAFFQDEILLATDALWLTLGTKYEHNDHTNNEWQPSTKLLWKPASGHSLWGSVARAVRTPSPFERYGRLLLGVIPAPQSPQGFVPISLTGNPNFISEILIAYETGYRWQARETLSFDLALFYNDYDKIYSVQATTPSPTGINYDFVNGVAGSSDGFEAAVDWRAASWLTFNLTYAYLQMDLGQEFRMGSNSFLSDLVMASTPRHQASLRTSIALAKDVRLNLWLRAVDAIACRDASTPPGPLVPLDSYYLLDSNLIWTPRKGLEVMLAGQNLTNTNQLQYQAETGAPPTVIGTSVYGKITWNF